MPDKETGAVRSRNLELFRAASELLHDHLLSAEPTSAEEELPPLDDDRPRGMHRFSGYLPDIARLDTYTFDFLKAAREQARDEGIAFFDVPRSSESYVLIVVGVGDGKELCSIVEHAKPHFVVIVEPDMKAMWRTIDDFDWSILFDALHERGTEIQFMFNTSADAITSDLWRIIRRFNPCSADGLTVVANDHPELVLDILDNLHDQSYLIGANLGFFYDELLMQSNTYKNFTRRQQHVFRRRAERDPGLAAFVVGSGPSLDWALPAIREHAGHAVVISAGSALRPLLKGGVMPDFQIEIENLEVTPVVETAAAEQDLSALHLVTSSTVDPTVLEKFQNIVFFLRHELSPYVMLFGTPESTFKFPGPTVANAALCFAQELGFRDIYLFGCDMGSMYPDRHHSDEAYHNLPGVDFKATKNDIRVKANYGGVSFTNIGLYTALDNLKGAITLHGPGVRYFNCSDGGFVDGAEPTKPEDIDLAASQEREKAAAVAEIVEDFIHTDPEGFADAWPNREIEAEIADYAGELTQRLDAIEDFTDLAFWRDLMDFFRPDIGYFDTADKSTHMAINYLFRGSLLTCLMFFHYYHGRVADAAHVQRFGEIARDALKDRLEEMRRVALDMLAQPQPKEPPPFGSHLAPEGSVIAEGLRIPRNAACPCGSGQRYKACHGRV